MEAAACATPTLASDVAGLRDAVRDGITGFLIPHQDIDAWARRMTEILTDPPLRARLGAAAQAWARGFGWDVQAEKMRATVEAVAKGQ
jgi:glycosyltransferase involved in cell wall biosynthesis